MKSDEERVKSILKKASDYKMKKRREGYALVTCICAVLVAVVVGLDATTVVSDKENVDLTVLKVAQEELKFNNLKEKELITFDSKAELIKKLKSSKAYKERYIGEIFSLEKNMMDATLSVDTGMAISQETREEASTKEYSETNTQVQGVDESDIVKTNGDYIYYLSKNKLNIFNNKEDLKLEKEIEFGKDEDSYVYASELYLSDKYIVVIATSSIGGIVTYDSPVEKIALDFGFIENEGHRTSTKILVYDIDNYDLVREIETEGYYASSRKVDDDIYLISNKYIYLYNEIKDDEIIPLYKDSCVLDGKLQEVPISSIKCFPEIEDEDECSYMIITSFSLDKVNEKANIETYIGTGNEIYCSKENLYVTKQSYSYEGSSKEETKIRKFAIYDGKIKYVAEGKVEGSLLNQFSMDEYEGNFRIATTKGNTLDETSYNNLYVLNENLNVIGKLEGLAKGERIYSTRFMGDKCYMVTYKTVDPLFVLDLSIPTNPKVLGELKIPGYSSYLHPLGENYLIGFGEDSVEKIIKNYDGTDRVTAYSTGLKLAIFDVTDYNNPKELDSVKIGGRGSYSSLLYNHKALLFKEDEGLFAFPVSLYTEDAGTYENGVPKYGKLEFKGAIFFDIDVENGITLRGKVSNNEGAQYGTDVERILYIGDKLYTLSEGIIKVLDIKTVKELDKIEF